MTRHVRRVTGDMFIMFACQGQSEKTWHTPGAPRRVYVHARCRVHSNFRHWDTGKEGLVRQVARLVAKAPWCCDITAGAVTRKSRVRYAN